jgi:hypothetical protein
MKFSPELSFSMIDISPLLDAPALVVKNDYTSLVIADVHLGIEYDLYYSGINIPSQIALRMDRVKGYIGEADPDRIILLPGGHLGFVEAKAPGEKPRPLQLARHRLLRGLGFRVYVLDDERQIGGILDEIRTT